jgi:DNA-binding transcriptional MerR regulator
MTDKLYYKIGEVCELTELKSSVLRFWEKEFKQLRPIKSGGGQRFYSKKHLELVFLLKRLLYEEKLTIEGVRRKLSKALHEPARAVSSDSASVLSSDEIKKELMDILEMLKDK